MRVAGIRALAQTATYPADSAQSPQIRIAFPGGLMGAGSASPPVADRQQGNNGDRDPTTELVE